MTWSELIKRVAARTELSEARVGRILSTTVDVALEALGEGEDVPLYGLGTVTSVWRAPRTFRSIADRRRLRLDGRYLAKFRPSKRLRETLAERTPQTWRDPEHQAAWRIAETLVGDLALYHGSRAPTEVGSDTPLDTVETLCSSRFGPLWAQVRRSYDTRVPDEIRTHTDYLALAARSRWAAREQT